MNKVLNIDTGCLINKVLNTGSVIKEFDTGGVINNLALKLDTGLLKKKSLRRLVHIVLLTLNNTG